MRVAIAILTVLLAGAPTAFSQDSRDTFLDVAKRTLGEARLADPPTVTGKRSPIGPQIYRRVVDSVILVVTANAIGTGYRSREAETPAATAPSPPSVRPIPSRPGRARVPERLEAVFAFAQKRTLERLSEPARKVYDWLQDHSEWHGRADIVAGSGIDIEQWREAIAELSGAQLIEATGSRRITMYRVRTG